MGFAKFYAIALAACLVALLSARTSKACSCIATKPRKKFCQAQFVLQVTVTQNNTINNFLVYSVNIDKEYKIADNATKAILDTYHQIFTPDASSYCNIDLLVGKTYVISGSIVEYKPIIDLCSSMGTPLDHVTEKLKKGLEGGFAKTCPQKPQ